MYEINTVWTTSCVCDREFEKNASGLLGTLHEIDKCKSRELIKRPLKTWNNSDILELAYNADLTDFMNNDGCQDILDKIWHGNLSTTISLWQVRLNTLHFVTLLRLIFRTSMIVCMVMADVVFVNRPRNMISLLLCSILTQNAEFLWHCIS